MSVYNGAAHLRQSVESILAQDFADFEFIIVNDGSTDGSRAVLAGYEERDRRVRVIDQENKGLTKALICGCEAARGEFIARQDADDISLSSRLRRLAASLEAGRIAFVSSWSQALTPSGEPLELCTRPDDPQRATEDLLDRRVGPPGHGSVMFRRSTYEKVGGYRWQFYYGQDSDLWMRLAEHGWLAYVPEPLYQFRRDPDSISSVSRDFQRIFGQLGRACLEARRRGEPEVQLLAAAARLRAQVMTGGRVRSGHRNRRAATHYLIGCGLAKRGDRHAAQYLWKAIQNNPLHWRAWFRLIPALVSRPGGQQQACHKSSGGGISEI
jgi:glycosyltransferase involved in cell wall biosynthesis